MKDAPIATQTSTPNIYFVDDSPTMREVVKISFRREHFNVLTCADVSTAVDHFMEARPDAVISDVIMPDRDGYQLCEYVKQHPEFASTPVILLSGVVNRDVAARAHQAGADELMRKPFHPHELVACVKKLLSRGITENESLLSPATQPANQPLAVRGTNPLSQLFGVPLSIPSHTVISPPPPLGAVTLGEVGTPKVSTSGKATQSPVLPSSPEFVKLRAEVRRLEALVKKLQSQLDTEREYCASLESQLRSASVVE